MNPSIPSVRPGPPRLEADHESERTTVWDHRAVVRGALAGVLGSGAVAIFFLLADLVAAQPFWTPAALGSRLFLGELLVRGDPVQPVLVAGYTAVHAGVFIGMGFAAASLATYGGYRRSPTTIAGLALALFVALEATILAFRLIFATQGEPEFGWLLATVANAIAALVMAPAVLVRVPEGD